MKRPTLEELESFFDNYYERNKAEEINLSGCEVIVDPIKFYKTHINYLRNNKGNKMFLPYYERLEKLKAILDVPKSENPAHEH